MRTSTFFYPERPSCGPADDLRNRYSLNQDLWREYWSQVRSELLALLPQLPDKFPEELVKRFPRYYQDLNMRAQSVVCAYAFLAHKRHLAATQIVTQKNTDLDNKYGEFRDYDSHLHENIFSENLFWTGSYQAIRQHLTSLLFAINDVKIEAEVKWKGDNQYIIFQDYTVCVRKYPRMGETKCSAYYHPFDIEGQNETDTVHIHFNISNDRFDSIGYCKLFYASVFPDLLKLNVNLAETYYKSCREASDSREFMLNAGRLAHVLVHSDLVIRGNATIIEELINTLAEEKNLQLDLFSYHDRLTWDWKALLTPSREAYAVWYADHCYQHVTENSRMFNKKQKM